MSMSVAVSSRAVSDRLPAALRRPGLLVPVMLAFVIGIGFVLRVHDAGVRSLWVDELFSVGLATQDLRTILMVLYGEEANMTLKKKPYKPSYSIFLKDHMNGQAGEWDPYLLGHHAHS